METKSISLKHKLILISVLVFVSQLVIGDFRLRVIIYPLLWIGLPFFIYSSLPKIKSIIIITLLVLFSFAYVLIPGLEALRYIGCSYGPKNYEYVNKKNKYIKIVGRDFSCYGTIGDLVLYKEISFSKSIKMEIYYKTFVEYKNISVDTTIWKRIER